MKRRAIWATESRDPNTGNRMPNPYNRYPCTVIDYGPVQGTYKIKIDGSHPDYPRQRTFIVDIADLWRETPDGWEHAT